MTRINQINNQPRNQSRPEQDEVIHEVKKGPDGEDLWIIKMTKRSAKLTLFISLLFSSDSFLPTTVIQEPVQEFIFEGNELKRARTASQEFLVAPEHMHPKQLDEGAIKIHISPMIRQVKHYSLETENYEIEHYPFFSVHQYVYLMCLVLIFSIIQLTAPLSSFPRFGLWVFSIGCIFAYLLVYISSVF